MLFPAKDTSSAVSSANVDRSHLFQSLVFTAVSLFRVAANLGVSSPPPPPPPALSPPACLPLPAPAMTLPLADRRLRFPPLGAKMDGRGPGGGGIGTGGGGGGGNKPLVAATGRGAGGGGGNVPERPDDGGAL